MVDLGYLAYRRGGLGYRVEFAQTLGVDLMLRYAFLLVLISIYALPAEGAAGGVMFDQGLAKPVLAQFSVEVQGRDKVLLTGAPRWQGEARDLVARMENQQLDVTLRLHPEDDAGAITLSLVLRYRQTVAIKREFLRVRLDGVASVLGRDLRFAELRRATRVDRGTPILAATRNILLVGEAGIPAARYLPLKDGAVTSEIELILDDEDSHPFATFIACRRTYLPPHAAGTHWTRRPPASLERKHSLALRWRSAGEEVQARAAFKILTPGENFVPLIVERWARGARAAVAFSDHADRTDPQALRAVLYGTSDRAAPGYGQGGFFGHGLKLTKTFFARGGAGTIEDDPAALALAEEMVRAGSEVGPHSASPWRDERAAVQKALDTFARLGATTWIDHQPETNCEAIANQGWSNDGPYGIRDFLVRAGYRWLWAATDIKSSDMALTNLFMPQQPSLAAPVYFPLPSGVAPSGQISIDNLWVFSTSWFFGLPGAWGAAVQKNALDRLEQERGLFVGHTYVSAWQAKTAYLRSRALVVQRGKELWLAPVVEAALGRLGARVKEGKIASLTWREVGDRLRSLEQVEVRYRRDGSVSVENHGASTINGLTLALPVSQAQIKLEDCQLAGQQNEPGRTTFWFDLPAGGHAVVRAEAQGKAIWHTAAGRVTVREAP